MGGRSGMLHVGERLLQRVAQALQRRFDGVLHSVDHDLLLMLLLLLQLRKLLLLELVLLRKGGRGRLLLKCIIPALLLRVVLSRVCSW